MDTPDPLNDQLTHLADAIDVSDAQLSLSSVRHTAARRRRRRSVMGGTAAVAALVGGVLVIAGVTGNGDSDSIAIDGANAETPTTDAPTGTAVDGTDDAAGDTTTDPTASADVPTSAPSFATTRVVSIAPNARAVAIGAEAAESRVEWIVPWQEGFLAGRVNYTPQPLPSELPEEITALFSQDVLDLFADGLPPTIEEATAMLSDAGLLDEVTQVLADNPEANAAVFSVGTQGPDTEVMFSADGIDWAPIDFTAPDGVFGLYGIQSTGSRLAVATQTFDPPTGSVDGNLNDQTGTIVVATTTDLVNWDTTTVDAGGRPADLPPEVHYQTSPGTLAMNDSGWVLPTNTYSDLDIESILPDDIRNRVQNGGGYGSSFDDAGVTIELFGDRPVETTADEVGSEVEFSEPDVVETLTFTWEELGIDPVDIDALDQRPTSKVFASTWGGTPQPVDGVRGWSVIAAGDGFYSADGNTVAFSADGVSWSALETPVEDVSIGTVKALPDSALVFVADDDGAAQVFRVSGSDGVWELLDVPGAPTAMFDVFGNGSSTSAMLVDGSEPVLPEPSEITVESDGYTMVMGQDRATTVLSVTDAAGEVVAAEEHNWNSDGEPTAWRYGRSGIEILDPDSGDVIVTFGNDVLEVAYSEQTNRNDQFSEFDPDLWLVATATGDRWLIEDLDVAFDYARSEPGALALNGTTLLVSVGEGWTRYDLS